jgi:hypothetical protein
MFTHFPLLLLLLIRDMGYYYYTRIEEGQQYKLHCRRPVPAGAAAPSEADAVDLNMVEELLLDENARKAAGNFSFYMVRGEIVMCRMKKLFVYIQLSTAVRQMRGTNDVAAAAAWPMLCQTRRTSQVAKLSMQPSCLQCTNDNDDCCAGWVSGDIPQ